MRTPLPGGITALAQITSARADRSHQVGAVKIALALALLAGLWVDELVRPAGIALAALMVGALGMHIKAGDSPRKSLPAATILVLSAVAAIAA